MPRFAARAAAATLIVASTLALPVSLAAQGWSPPHIPAARGDFVFLGEALVFASGASLLDHRFALEMQEPDGFRRDMRGATSVGKTIGQYGPIGLTVAAYGVGRLTHHDALTRTGRDGAVALLLAGAATTFVKGVVGRERPNVANGDPDVYKFGHGFTNNAFASFPSGHTSGAFAIATVLDRETAHSSTLVHRTTQIAAYGLATSVGLSRMYQNMHWSSDVIAGAAVGITSGLIATRHTTLTASAPPGELARALSHVSVAPARRGGVTLGVSFH